MDLNQIKPSNKIKKDYEDIDIIYFEDKPTSITIENKTYPCCYVCESNFYNKNK